MTTLNKVREQDPCSTSWFDLLDYDAPLALENILESNGAHDAIWALRALDKTDENKNAARAYFGMPVDEFMSEALSIIANGIDDARRKERYKDDLKGFMYYIVLALLNADVLYCTLMIANRIEVHAKTTTSF